MSKPTIYGVWKHEIMDHGSRTVTTQTIGEDATYETHMIFAIGDGCQQHIHHFGTIEIRDGKLKLNFHSGQTKITGCQDPSRNVDLRDFNQAEIEEATALLAQEIPYSIEGDRLTITVSGPMGEIKIAYNRQSD